MNFLAHLYLSGNDEALAIGNIMGDFVRAYQVKELPDSIQRGIFLHRKIDTFTDAHPLVKKGRERLWPKYRHYGRVLIDLYYDHFLAKNWNQYSSQNLNEYSVNFYNFHHRFEQYIPLEMKQMLHVMEQQNWLYEYRHIEGMQKAFDGLSRRSTYGKIMKEGAVELQIFYSEFELEFTAFFEEIVLFLKTMHQ